MDENGLTEAWRWMSQQIVGENLDKDGRAKKRRGQRQCGRGQVVRLLLARGSHFQRSRNIQAGTAVTVPIKMAGLFFVMVMPDRQRATFRTTGLVVGQFEGCMAVGADA